MSDRGIPRTYRHMHGFGSHTFSFINADNERFWVKFHLETQQGIENLSDQEAETLVGQNRESHQQDLYEAIENGDFPKWNLKSANHARKRSGRLSLPPVRFKQSMVTCRLSTH